MGKILIGITFGLASAFIGYCIYFDKQRRSDPDYKKKVYQRRLEQKIKNPPQPSPAKRATQEPPGFEELERYFMQEIQLGEHLVATGAFEEGVVHLVNGILVCQSPIQLVQMLRQQMPPDVHRMLIDRLKLAKEQIERNPDSVTSMVFQRATSSED